MSLAHSMMIVSGVLLKNGLLKMNTSQACTRIRHIFIISSFHHARSDISYRVQANLNQIWKFGKGDFEDSLLSDTIPTLINPCIHIVFRYW